jgi:phospholipid/cholesterol/gamma-HCH transport system ATP-binding protein
MEPIVAIQNMYFARENQNIFKGIHLSIPRHKITAIMGPSGTGKTTLLHLIGGQLKPSSGQIKVNGLDVSALKVKELYQLRRKMGVLFQEGGLFTDLNVFENVAFSLREHTRLPEDMINDMVLMMLEAVGLRGVSQYKISELSGGMSRRVALARAIILAPELMMYDEPFTGQDPIGRGVLLKLIKEMNDALHLTSIVVSHDVKETASIADYVYILFEGQVVGEGTPEQLFTNPSPSVKQFVHGLPDGVISFHRPAKNFQQELGL